MLICCTVGGTGGTRFDLMCSKSRFIQAFEL